MNNCNSQHHEQSWGDDLCILCASDQKYLPGVYALYNSAKRNGFSGNFFLLVSEDDQICLPSGISSLLTTLTYRKFGGNYLANVNRLSALRDLAPGKYLFVDADVIIERPLHKFLEMLTSAPLVSTEPEAKADLFDVLTARQIYKSGLSVNLRPSEYINCGFFGFMLPRDQKLIIEWARLSEEFFEEQNTYAVNPDWYFLEQDVLNILIRQPDQQAFSISSRHIEIGGYDTIFQNRTFPHETQDELRPKDQLKYVIHGAGLRRPWLLPQRANSVAGRLTRAIKSSDIALLRRKLKPYERAWAYYACSEGMPIPVSAWADQHGFTGYKRWLWRKAYGLS